MPIVDFLVLTPLDEEWRTVRSVLCPDNVRTKPIEAITYYLWNESLDDPRTGQGGYLIVAASMGNWTPGQAFAGVFSNESLANWKPARAVLVGIAGSLEPDRIPLGDVVVSAKIIGYEVAEAKSDGILFRTTSNEIDALDLDRIRAFRDDPNDYPAWQKECEAAAPASGLAALSRSPTLHLEVTASGNFVVMSTDFGKKLREIDKNISAVEMEARGLHLASYLKSQKVNCLNIRGVSDYADENKSELDRQSKDAYRKFATANAARLLRRLWRRTHDSPLSPGYELNLSVGPRDRFRETEFQTKKFNRAGAQQIAFPRLLDRKRPTPELMLEVRAVSDADKAASGYQGICMVESTERRVLSGQESPSGAIGFALPASEGGLRAELLLSFPSRVVEVTVKCSDDFGRSDTQATRSLRLPWLGSPVSFGVLGGVAVLVLALILAWGLVRYFEPGAELHQSAPEVEGQPYFIKIPAEGSSEPTRDVFARFNFGSAQLLAGNMLFLVVTNQPSENASPLAGPPMTDLSHPDCTVNIPETGQKDLWVRFVVKEPNNKVVAKSPYVKCIEKPYVEIR